MKIIEHGLMQMILVKYRLSLYKCKEFLQNKRRFDEYKASLNESWTNARNFLRISGDNENGVFSNIRWIQAGHSCYAVLIKMMFPEIEVGFVQRILAKINR